MSSDFSKSIEFVFGWTSGEPVTLTAILPDRGAPLSRTISASNVEAALAWLSKADGDRNIYFTVNQASAKPDQRPKKVDIDRIFGFQVDLDPEPGESIETQQVEILRRISGFSPPPTAIVFSGGGYQGFWKLEKPLPASSATSVEFVNKAIAGQLGGDHCHSIEHLMRMPWTINLPNKKKRALGRVPASSEVVQVDWSRTYTLEDFSFLMPSNVSPPQEKTSHFTNGVANIGELRLSPRIQNLIMGIQDSAKRYASRSEAVFAVLIAMTSAGYDDDAIEQLFLDEKPPIAESVLEKRNPADYLKRQIAKARDYARDPQVAEINEKHALIIIGDKAVIMKGGRTFDGKENFSLLSIGAFLNWYGNRFVLDVTADGGSRKISLGRYWLTHPLRRQYEGIVFAPGQDVVNSLNLWRGFAVVPAKGDCSLFLNHVRDNVCKGNDELFKWVIAWFADIIQHPGRKSGTSLVIRGREGTGKTKVGEIIGSLFGDHYLAVSDPRYVTGRFNSHMTSCLLLHCEEAFWAGDHAGESKLKDLITGTHHLIEYKGKEPIKVQNFIRLLITGNPDWVVPVGMEARRFAVLEISDEHMRDTNYFAAIDQQMNSGGREALLQYLLDFDLGKVDLRAIPKTAALLDQKIASFTPEQGWWVDVLARGILPWGCEMANECPAERLFDDYIMHASKSGARRRSIQTKLGSFLKKAVQGLTKRSTTYRAPGNREIQGSVYEFPSLADCRAHFAALLEQEIEWDGPDDWLKTDDPAPGPDGEPM